MQLAFDFRATGPWRPERRERLFFGVLLDAETSGPIDWFADGLTRDLELEGRRVAARHLHISLHHIGDYGRLRSAFVYAAREAAKDISLPPFEICFSVIKSFENFPAAGTVRRRRPIVLLGKGEAASHLHGALGAAMKRNGLRPGGRFTPHITLLYSATPVAARTIEPVRIAVSDFALIHSQLGLTRYEVIDRWPLKG